MPSTQKCVNVTKLLFIFTKERNKNDMLDCAYGNELSVWEYYCKRESIKILTI